MIDPGKMRHRITFQVFMGVQDTFGRSGKVPPLLEMYGLNAETIIAKAEAALRLKKTMGK